VTVEGNSGTAMTLPEVGATGNYTGVLNLDVTKEYRLRIRKDGKEYLSDYVPVTQSPDIDSVNWKWENDGVMIYANTHDVTNKSKYYKWEYDETWEIISPFYTILKVIGLDSIVHRDFPAEDVSHCWKYGSSTSIMLGSSAQLTSDIISDVPVYYLPKNTEKIGVRYSILVKQMVLTKEGYEYFLQMKKNTEQLGSIFDPLPSELRGNIHCLTDDKEPVIGYVTAGSVKEKRIFIVSNQVPQWHYSYSGACTSLLVPNKRDSIRKYLGAYAPYDEDRPNPLGIPLGYYFVQPPCADCTLRGGSNVKPSYW
jgi:hypothetical protein